MNSLPVRFFHAVVLGAMLAAMGAFVIGSFQSPKRIHIVEERALPIDVPKVQLPQSRLPSPASSPGPLDTDGDGIPNAWELANFHDPNNPEDAGKDFDLDGLTAKQEYDLSVSSNGAFGNPLGTNTVTTIPDPPGYDEIQMLSLTETASNGMALIHVVGTRTGESISTGRVYTYNPRSDTWTHVLPPADFSEATLTATDINTKGQVVGYFESGGIKGFLWTPSSSAPAGGESERFFIEPSSSSPISAVPVRISDAGYLLYSETLYGELFAADPQQRFIDPIDNSWTSPIYCDVNDFGEYVGTIYNPVTGFVNTFLAVENGPLIISDLMSAPDVQQAEYVPDVDPEDIEWTFTDWETVEWASYDGFSPGTAIDRTTGNTVYFGHWDGPPVAGYTGIWWRPTNYQGEPWRRSQFSQYLTTVNDWGEFGGAASVDITGEDGPLAWDPATYTFNWYDVVTPLYPYYEGLDREISYFFDGSYHLTNAGWRTYGISNDPQILIGDNLPHSLWSDSIVVPLSALLPAEQSAPVQVKLCDKGVVLLQTESESIQILKPLDSDGDGLPDDWEAYYGFNPNLGDAGNDVDGDGLDNLGEFLLRTNPHAVNATGPTGEPIDVRPGVDTDGDGIPNMWEWQHGLDYEDASDAVLDQDRDGFTNLQEFHLNTDPNGAPRFRVREIGPFTGMSSVDWSQLTLTDDDSALFGGNVVSGGSVRAAWKPAVDSNSGTLDLYPSHGSGTFTTKANASSGAVVGTVGSPATLVFWPSSTSTPISLSGTNTRSISSCRLSPGGAWLVGWRIVHSTGVSEPFVWEMPTPGHATTPSKLVVPSGSSLPSSSALYVNDYGHVAATGLVGSANRGILWSAPTSGILLNNLSGGTFGQVVGLSNVSSPKVAGNANTTGGITRAVTWTSTGGVAQIGSLSAGNSTAVAMAPDGTVAGTYQVLVSGSLEKQVFAAKPTEGYLLRPQGDPDANASVTSVNSNGEIFGRRSASLLPTLWRAGRMFPLEDVVPSSSGYLITTVGPMNARGAMLARAYKNNIWVNLILTTDVDTDSDGIPDSYENAHGTSPYTAADGTADADQDGLTNLDEFRYGTDPRRADTDGDGMPDKWEIEWGFSATDPGNGPQDPDGDQVSNLREYQIETSPTGIYQLDYQTYPPDYPNYEAGPDGSIIATGETTWYGVDIDEVGSGGYYIPNFWLPAGAETWINLPSSGSARSLDSEGNGEIIDTGYGAAFMGEGKALLFRTQNTFHYDDLSEWDDPVDFQFQIVGTEGVEATYPLTAFEAGIDYDPDLEWVLAMAASPQGASWVFSIAYGTRSWVVSFDGTLRSSFEIPAGMAISSVNDAGHVLMSGLSGIALWNGDSMELYDWPEGWSSDSWAVNFTADNFILLAQSQVFVGNGMTTRHGLFNRSNGDIEEIYKPSPGGFGVDAVSEGRRLLGSGTKPWLSLRNTPVLIEGLQVTGSGLAAGTKVRSLGWKNMTPVSLSAVGDVMLDVVKGDDSHAFAFLRPLIDADNDGVPDDWERSVIKQLNDSGMVTSTDIALFNANADHDGDGVSLLDEWKRGTSDGSKENLRALGAFDGPSKDRDGDGIPNAEDADPDDRIIDWKKGPEPLFVIRPLPSPPEPVSQTYLRDLSTNGSVLFSPSPVLADFRIYTVNGDIFDLPDMASFITTTRPSVTEIDPPHTAGSYMITRQLDGGLGGGVLSSWFDAGDVKVGVYGTGSVWGISASGVSPSWSSSESISTFNQVDGIQIHPSFTQFMDFEKIGVGRPIRNSAISTGQYRYTDPYSCLKYFGAEISGNLQASENSDRYSYIDIDQKNNVLAARLAQWEVPPTLHFWEFNEISSEYSDRIDIPSASAGLPYTATLSQSGPFGSADLVRHLVPTIDGLFVAKNNYHYFSKSNVGAGMFNVFTVPGITAQSWIALQVTEGASYLWVNGKWKEIGQYVVNNDEYQVLSIERMQENGMAVALVQSGTEDPQWAWLVPVDVDASLDSSSHPSLDSANVPYMREVHVNGIQKSDGKPQEGAEIDIPGEESSVDAFSRRLRHDSSIAYADVPASDLDLAVKISVDPNPFKLPSLDALRVQPNGRDDFQQKVAFGAEAAAALEIGSFGLGWRTNLDGGVVCRPVYKDKTPRSELELASALRTVDYYDVEVVDENGTKYSFTSKNLKNFTLQVGKNIVDEDQYLVSLVSKEDGNLRLQKKFGTTTDFAWVNAPPPTMGNQHSAFTAGLLFLPVPYRATLAAVSDRAGEANKITYSGFGRRWNPVGTATRTIKARGSDSLALTIGMTALSGPGSKTRFDLVTSVTNPRGFTVRMEYDWINCMGGKIPVLARVIQPDGSTVRYGYDSHIEAGDGPNAVSTDIWKRGMAHNAPTTPGTLGTTPLQKALEKEDEDEEENDRDLASFFHINLASVQTASGKVTSFVWENDVRYETTLVWLKSNIEINDDYPSTLKTYLNGYKEAADEFQKKKTWKKIDRQQAKRGAVKIGQGMYVSKARGVPDVIKNVKVSSPEVGSPVISFTLEQPRPAPVPYVEDGESPILGGGYSFLKGAPDLPGGEGAGGYSNPEIVTTVTDVEERVTSYRFSDFHTIRVPKPDVDPGAPEPELEPQQALSEELNRTLCTGYKKMEFFHDPTHKVTYEFDPDASYALARTVDLNSNVTEYEHGDDLGSRVLSVTPFIRHNHSGNHATPIRLFTKYGDPTAEVKKDSVGNELTRKEYSYDEDTRIMSSVIDARGNQTDYKIDDLGRTEEENSYHGKGTSKTLVSKKTFAHANLTFPLFVTTETIVNLSAAGDPSWVTDRVTNYTADLFGRIEKTTVDPGGLAIETETTYDAGGNVKKKKDPLGNETLFEYDNVGRLVSVENPDHTTRWLGYDADSRKIRETDELGHSTLWRYDGFGRVVQTGRDMNGNHRIDVEDLIAFTTYNHLGQTVTSTDPNGNLTRNTYDDWHRLIATTRFMSPDDETGIVNGFDYSGANSGTGLANDAKWLPTRVVDPRGYVTETDYDALYRPVAIRKEYKKGSGSGGWTVRGLGPCTDAETDYDKNGNAIETRTRRSSSDPFVRSATDFDALGRAYRSTSAVGTSLESTARTLFTSTGLGYESIAFEGNTALEKHTATKYDAAGRVVEVKGPDPSTGLITSNSAVVETHYDNASNVTYTLDALGHRTDFEYDVRNRRTKTLAPSATDASAVGSPSVRAQTLTSYDAVGNVETVTDHYGTISRTYYDAANRAWKVVAAEGDGEEAVTISEFDRNGNVITAIDANGNKTRNLYDSLNRLIGTTVNSYYADPSTSPAALRGGDIVVANQYDESGNLTRVADGEAGKTWTGGGWTLDEASGHVTGFDYDGLGRKTATRWDVGSVVERVEASEYDALYLTKRTDPRGRETAYSYDVLGRVTSVTPVGNIANVRESFYAGGTGGASGPGPLESVTWPNSATGASSTIQDTANAYDRLDRTTAETSADVTHQYQFDKGGNRVLVTYGATYRKIVSKFDSNNRLTQAIETQNTVSNALTYTAQVGDRVTSYHYDALGRTVKVVMPNGNITTHSYDRRGRTQLLRTTDSSLLVLSSFNYAGGYDAVGNVLSFTESSATLPHRTVTNVYDKTYRLRTEKAETLSQFTETLYEYDRASNRTSKFFKENTAYFTSGLRAVFGTPATGFNTNQIRTLSSGSVVVEAFTYDANGNRATREAGGQTDTYTYDYDNRLVQLVKNTTGGTGTYKYAYDYRTRRVLRDEPGTNDAALTFSGGQSVQEYTPSTGPSATPLVETVRGSDMGGGVGGVLYTLRGTAASYNSYNSRGDVVAQSNDGGGVEWAASYQAFGTRTTESGTNLDRQRANTKDEDPTGLLNEGMRYRDLVSGVFITRDPAGFVDGPNVYAYVRQNPWSAFDPEGLETKKQLEERLDVYDQSEQTVIDGYDKSNLSEDEKKVAKKKVHEQYEADRKDLRERIGKIERTARDMAKVYGGAESDYYAQLDDSKSNVQELMKLMEHLDDYGFRGGATDFAKGDTDALAGSMIKGVIVDRVLRSVKYVKFLKKGAKGMRLPKTRADLHVDLRKKGFEYKSTSKGGYTTYKHADGRKVTIKPSGEVISQSPATSEAGKAYNQRTDYDFNRLPDQSHSTDHAVESFDSLNK